MKYRERLDAIEAIQYTGQNESDIVAFTNGKAHRGKMGSLLIPCQLMAFSSVTVFPGNYVVKDKDGFYPMSEDRFNKFYEPYETSTKSLVEELTNREGVKHFWIYPEGSYDINIDNNTNGGRNPGEGPARILVVTD